MRANGREARSPIARSNAGRWRSVPSASSVARLRSRASNRERSSNAGSTRVEYASSSVTRRTVSTATDRAVVMSRTDRRSDRERHGPNPRPASDAGRARRPRAVARRPSPVATTTPSRSAPTMVPAVSSSVLGPSARSSLRSLPRNVVFAPGSGANARTRRTTESAGRVQSTTRSAGPSLGARVAVPACGVGFTMPAASRGEHVRDRLGADLREARAKRPRVIVRPDRLLALRQLGPVSMPSSIRITVMPVTASPSRIACCTGLAPRHRGRSEKCRFTEPRWGASSTVPASSSP